MQVKEAIDILLKLYENGKIQDYQVKEIIGLLSGDESASYKNVRNKLFGLLSNDLISREFIDSLDAMIKEGTKHPEIFQEYQNENNKKLVNDVIPKANNTDPLSKVTNYDIIRELNIALEEYPNDQDLEIIITRFRTINDALYSNNTAILYKLKNECKISTALYDKAAGVLLRHKNTNTYGNRQRVRSSASLEGSVVGFGLAFTLGIGGVILCHCLGDDDCKHTADVTLIVMVSLIVAGLLIWGLVELILWIQLVKDLEEAGGYLAILLSTILR